MARHLLPLAVVTITRAHVSSVAVITSLLVMLGGPLVVAAPHEVCDAMRHGCDKIDALATCCCGDRSEASPSPVPSTRTDLATSPHAVAAVVVQFAAPAVAALPVHQGLPALARPPDLPILFADLRL